MTANDIIERNAKCARQLLEAGAEVARLRALVREAYREGVEHGEDSATAYEWGSPPDRYKTWEHSEAKAALDNGQQLPAKEIDT